MFASSGSMWDTIIQLLMRVGVVVLAVVFFCFICFVIWRCTKTTQPSQPKRRWCRFSLKTLLIVVTLFTVVVGWVGIRMNRARANRERVAAAKKANERTVAALESLIGTCETKQITLRSRTWLEELYDDPGGRDDPVSAVHLKSVILASSFAVDADLEQLQGLTHLQYLELDGTKITDAGLERLNAMENLVQLDLMRTNVTDAGLEHLKGLKSLQSLFLWGTDVTDAGIKKLRKSLPNCNISRL